MDNTQAEFKKTTPKPNTKTFEIEVLGKDVVFELDADDARSLAMYATQQDQQSAQKVQQLVSAWVPDPAMQNWLVQEFVKFENALLADKIIMTIGEEIAPILQATSLVKLKTSVSPK